MSNQWTYLGLMLEVQKQRGNAPNTVHKKKIPTFSKKVCEYIKKKKRIRGNYLTLTGKEKH